MAYTKQEWIAKQTVITAERMNHIEDGIAALSEATGTQWFFTAIDVQSGGTVALTDIVVPDGWTVASNSLLVDGHGDVYVITAVAGGNATVGNVLPVNLKGPKGDKGDAGVAGPAGPKGDKGDAGVAGPAGPKGDKGDAGVAGPAGPKGDKGDKGATGPAGPKGDKGDKGATGPAGAKGDKGDAGATGPAGAKGDKGDPGMTPQPAIDNVAAGADAAALVTAHNALLAALRKAGIIAAK